MKTAVIHRYTIAALGLTTIELPSGARVVSATPSRSGGLNLYASHVEPPADFKRNVTVRHFVLFKTGTSCPVSLFGPMGNFITTIGGLHLYECGPSVAAEFSELYPVIDEAMADAVIPGNLG